MSSSKAAESTSDGAGTGERVGTAEIVGGGVEVALAGFVEDIAPLVVSAAELVPSEVVFVTLHENTNPHCNQIKAVRSLRVVARSPVASLCNVRARRSIWSWVSSCFFFPGP